jgi:hypothetical protein
MQELAAKSEPLTPAPEIASAFPKLIAENVGRALGSPKILPGSQLQRDARW